MKPQADAAKAAARAERFPPLADLSNGLPPTGSVLPATPQRSDSAE
jgi:hypothetical protein